MTILRKRSLTLILLVLANMSLAHAQEVSDIELVCPDHVLVDCQSELKEIEEYGAAMIRVGEEINEMENQQTKRNIDDCEKGYLERIWRYKSEEGEEHKCSQKIYIGQDEQARPLIKWPTKEVVVSWCEPSYAPNDLPPEARRPHYFEGECNKMEHTYSDEIVYISESCKEVKRNWLVHDWCYDSKNIEGNDGHYKFTQTIKFAVPEGISYEELDDIYVTADDCEKVSVEMEDMKADFDECNRRLKISNDSPFANSKRKNASGTYPIGETTITYKVELECAEPRLFTQQVIVSNPCAEQAIIETKELELKLQKSFIRPNPFSTATEVYFHNVDQSSAQLVIRNTSGREVVNKVLSLDSQGMQSVKLSSADLQRPGVYLYNITIGDRNLEGKLIKIQ